MGDRTVYCGIYQITNEVNGHFYIGSSRDIKSRWRNHRKSFASPPPHRSRIWHAVSKYGIENFTFSIVEECSRESLIQREQYYLDALRPTYNICPIAAHPPVNRWNKGIPSKEWMSEEVYAKFCGPKPHLKGIPRTDELKRKLSEMQKGKPRLHQVGKTRPNSVTQEYGITFARDKKRHYCVRIQGRSYGYYATLEEAKFRRDQVLAGNVSPNPINRDPDYGVYYRKARNRWIVQLHKRRYGAFKTKEEAVLRRDLLVGCG